MASNGFSLIVRAHTVLLAKCGMKMYAACVGTQTRVQSTLAYMDPGNNMSQLVSYS